MSAGAGGLRARSMVPVPALGGVRERGWVLGAKEGVARGSDLMMAQQKWGRGPHSRQNRAPPPPGWSPRTPPPELQCQRVRPRPQPASLGTKGSVREGPAQPLTHAGPHTPAAPGPQGSAGWGAGGAPSGDVGLLAESCCHTPPDHPVTQVFAVRVLE